MQKKIQKKRLTKRTYVYLGLVTMAAVSLLAKPIKRGFSALERHLANAACEEKKANLRRDLDLWSERRHNEMINGEKYDGTDPFDKSLEGEIKSLKHQLTHCRHHKHELN